MFDGRCIFYDKIRLENIYGSDINIRFGSIVGSIKVGEDNGVGVVYSIEEGLDRC